MMTQTEMIAMIDASWRELDAAIAGLEETALLEPGVVESWSIKDLLGHVTAWEQLALQYLECWRRGEPPPVRDWDSTEAYNAREAARRASWTLAQVQDEAADTRRGLHAMLATITDEEWASRVTIRDRERPLGEWVGGALSGDDGPGTHAAEHAAQIRAWRAARERDVVP
jgi:hypothetical protein